jgi:hypothetical protein
MSTAWPFLETEPDLSDDDRDAAAALKDLLAREDFFRALPDIDQRTARLEQAYAARRAIAATARRDAYQQALGALRSTPGWDTLSEDQQAQYSASLAARAEEPGEDVAIPLLREQTANCDHELKQARLAVLRAIEGDRVERVSLAAYFQGGVETQEQLDAALEGVREQIEALIAAGKKVLVD